MTDYIIIDKIWQDVFCYQIKITCITENISVINKVYISDDGIDKLSNVINNFINGKVEKSMWQNGEKGDGSTAYVSFHFIRKDTLGHILVEVFLELDDGGSYDTHNCCFYINTELGLLEQFGKSVLQIKEEQLNFKVTLNQY